MKPRFKIEYYTEEEVLKVLNNKNLIEATYDLGLVPKLRFPFRTLSVYIGIVRLEKIMKNFKLI